MLTLPFLWLFHQLGLSLPVAEVGIDSIACFGYLIFVKRILTHFEPGINKHASLIAVIPLIVNYALLGYVGYPSDIASLFLFTAAAFSVLEDQFVALCRLRRASALHV